jgi:hypothetical protein
VVSGRRALAAGFRCADCSPLRAGDHGDFVGVYGTESPPVIHFYTGPSGDRAPVRVDEVTAETFDGHSNATQLEYVFLNGSDATNGFVGPATGTYQVKQDCTGTEMLTYPNGFEIDRAFVLSNGGRTIHILTIKIHTPFLPRRAWIAQRAAMSPSNCTRTANAANNRWPDHRRRHKA